MSLVGPRLQAPEQVARYSAADRKWLLAIRPGITGLATIEFKDEHELLTENENPEITHTEQIMPAKLNYNREYYARLKRGQWTVSGDIPRLRVCDAACPAVACLNAAQTAFFQMKETSAAQQDIRFRPSGVSLAFLCISI